MSFKTVDLTLSTLFPEKFKIWDHSVVTAQGELTVYSLIWFLLLGGKRDSVDVLYFSKLSPNYISNPIFILVPCHKIFHVINSFQKHDFFVSACDGGDWTQDLVYVRQSLFDWAEKKLLWTWVMLSTLSMSSALGLILSNTHSKKSYIMFYYMNLLSFWTFLLKM